jgi:threonyl-tRNA synthetase
VRKFQQDDTHIFCTQDQIVSYYISPFPNLSFQLSLTSVSSIQKGEIADLFQFLSSVYGLFGFSFALKLSTRPEKYMGKLSEWDFAEAQLKEALTEFCGNDWTIDEGDGAL